MAKHPKKRNKKRSISSQSDNTIRVHRVNAVVRSDFMQWVHDHKKIIRTSAIVSLVVGAVLFLTIQGIIAITK